MKNNEKNGYESRNEQPIKRNLNRKENGLCPCDCPNCNSENCIEREEWGTLNKFNGVGQRLNEKMGNFPGKGRGYGRKDKILKSTSVNEIHLILEEFNKVKESCPTAKMIEIRKTHVENNINKFTLIYVVNKDEFNSFNK